MSNEYRYFPAAGVALGLHASRGHASLTMAVTNFERGDSFSKVYARAVIDARLANDRAALRSLGASPGAVHFPYDGRQPRKDIFGALEPRLLATTRFRRAENLSLRNHDPGDSIWYARKTRRASEALMRAPVSDLLDVLTEFAFEQRQARARTIRAEKGIPEPGVSLGLGGKFSLLLTQREVENEMDELSLAPVSDGVDGRLDDEFSLAPVSDGVTDDDLEDDGF